MHNKWKEREKKTAQMELKRSHQVDVQINR